MDFKIPILLLPTNQGTKLSPLNVTVGINYERIAHVLRPSVGFPLNYAKVQN